GPIGIAYDHGRVEEDEAVPLAEPGDLSAELIGPLHAVEPDGPQMGTLNHCRSSGRTATESGCRPVESYQHPFYPTGWNIYHRRLTCAWRGSGRRCSAAPDEQGRHQ